MLGSRSQRGLIQLTLDVLFRSISKNLHQNISDPFFHESVAAVDSSEAQVISAQTFLETIFPDLTSVSRASRAQTPLAVCEFSFFLFINKMFLNRSLNKASSAMKLKFFLKGCLQGKLKTAFYFRIHFKL